MAITKVTTDVITALAVTAPKLAANAVTTDKLADNAVTAAKIAAGALGDQVAGITSSASATTIAGTLTSTGAITGTLATAAQTNITSLGTLTALTGGTGDLIWDSPTFVVDSSANSVGIGTTSPANNLHIHCDSGDEGILIKSTGDTSNAIVSDANRGSAGAAILATQGKWNGTTVADILLLTGADTSNKDDGVITFRTSSADNIAERMRIDASGFVGINTAGAASYTPLTLETASGSVFAAGGVNGVGLMLRNRSSTVGTSSGIKWAANSSYHDLGGIHMVLTGNSNTNETADMTFFTSNSGDSGNTEKMRIESAGNVGIGTNDPGSKLEVKSSGSTTNEIALVHSGNTVKIASLAQESSHGSLHLRANNGVDKVRLSAAGNSSYILDSNVGIGTSSPDNLLHLNIAGSNDIGLSISNSQYDYTLGIDTSDSASFKLSRHTGLGNYDLIKFHPTTYAATFTGTVLASAGTQSLPSLSFAGDPNTGIYSNSADNLGFVTGGVERGFWSASQLNVTGNGIFSGLGTFGGTLGVTGAITGAQITGGGNMQVNTTTADGGETRLKVIPGGAADDPQFILYRHDGVSASVYLRPGNYNYFENKILMGTQTSVNDPNGIGNPPVQLTDAEPGVSLYGTNTGTYSHSGGISFGSAGGGGADRSFFYIYAHPENWHVYNNSSRGFYFPQGSNATIAYASDERLKENIVDLNLGLTAINNLKPRRFDWKSDGQEDIGFVAQELKPHIPEAMQGSGADWVEGEEKGERDSKTLKIGNDKLIPVLVKAIQELSAELTAAKARITTLEG